MSKGNLTQKRLDKFKQILEQVIEKDGMIKILIAQVDPDAKGNAALFRYLVRQLIPETEVVAYHSGGVSVLNRKFFTFFSTREWFKPISELQDKNLGNVVLLDSSQAIDTRIRDYTYNPVIVIDHHNGCDIEEKENNWVWVEGLGASITLTAELAKSLKIKMENGEESQIAATLAALGIANDTHDFTEKVTHERDISAWQWLMNFRNADHYATLSKRELPKRYYELLHQMTCEENRENIFKESLLVANIGIVTEEEVDFLALYADLLIQRKDVKMVLVWAPVKGLGYAVKMRSTDISEDLETRIREIFRSGGAKSKWAVGAGGTFIYIDELLTPRSETEDVDKAFFKKHVEQKIAEIFNIATPRQ